MPLIRTPRLKLLLITLPYNVINFEGDLLKFPRILKAARYYSKAFPAFYMATPLIVTESTSSKTMEGPIFEKELSLRLFIRIFRVKEATFDR